MEAARFEPDIVEALGSVENLFLTAAKMAAAYGVAIRTVAGAALLSGAVTTGGETHWEECRDLPCYENPNLPDLPENWHIYDKAVMPINPSRRID